MRCAKITALALGALVGLGRSTGLAAITPPAGYVYDAQLLGSTTQSCIAVGPGGTFVGIGPGFAANAQAVVLAKESGELRLVAFGFNSISDCAYDATADILYVSDNADGGDLDGALTGDTVFAIPSASSASGLTARGLELVPENSLPFAASVTVDASGDVFVSDAAGGVAGSVSRIDGGGGAPTLTPFATGLDLAGGLAFHTGSGVLFAAETRSGAFDAQIRAYDAGGTQLPLFAGPSFAFGSFDLAFDSGIGLLATGLFGGDVVAFDDDGTARPFVGGLTFASGVTINRFTGRVEILSGFSGTDEDRSIHRLIPVDRLVAGRGRRLTECAAEVYGLELTAARDAACVDGAPCDADGTVNDTCLFPVGICLNIDDPDIPECVLTSPATSASVRTAPFNASLKAAAAELAAALPEQNAACSFSDGVAVPVRSTKQGKVAGLTRVRLEVVLGTGEKDVDRFRLICEPAAP
jgi:hypothetical protein